VIKEGLEAAGFIPEIQDLSYFQDDYGVKAGPNGDDDDVSEESDEEDWGEDEEEDWGEDEDEDEDEDDEDEAA